MSVTVPAWLVAVLRRLRHAVRAVVAWLRRSATAVWGWRKHRFVRFAGRAILVVVVALIGAITGVLVGGSVQHDVGPFRAEFTVTPSVSGEAKVVIPPLGSLTLDSHDAPLNVTMRLNELDPGRTQELISNPSAVDRIGRTAMADIEAGIRKLVLSVTGSAVLGALVLSVLVFRRDVRRVAAAGAVSLGLVMGTTGLALATFQPRSIEEPRYEGLLVNAPAVIGDARRIADRYDEYRAELQRLVTNVSRLYATISSLPAYEPDEETIRVLHVSDLHLNPTAFDLIATVTEQFRVDVVVDTGDITDWGSEREGQLYASGIGRVDAPYIFIRGNHDSPAVQAAVAAQDNAIVLDNHVGTVAGLTFAGLGDPRFTPDKSRSDVYTKYGLRLHTESLVETIESSSRQVDVALVHDPLSATPLDGVVPVVLAGHKHKRSVTSLDEGTLLMVQGSTGGAGLRGLETEKPTSLEMSVLYFDRESQTLQAYDDIVVGGHGLAEVRLERHVLDTAPGTTAPASPSPSPG
mgnify:CR=1 FL=1